MSNAHQFFEYLFESTADFFRMDEVLEGRCSLDETDTVETVTLGTYDAKGTLIELNGIVGVSAEGMPEPTFKLTDKYVWFFNEPRYVDSDYDVIERLTDIANPGDEAAFDQAITLPEVFPEFGVCYDLADFNKAKAPAPVKVNTDLMAREITLAMSPKGRTDLFGWKNQTSTVGELVNFLSQHEEGNKDGMAILQGSIVGKQRKAMAVDKLDLLILDLDTGEDIDKLEKRIRELGWFAVIYTTHSHMKPTTDVKKDTIIKFLDREDDEGVTVDDVCQYLIEEKRYQRAILKGAHMGEPVHKDEGIVYVVEHQPMPKFRAVFVLSETFVVGSRAGTQKAAIEEWKERYAGVAHTLDAAYDRSCVDPSRLMYTPRHPKGATNFSVRVIDGEALDIDTIKRVSLKGKKGPQNAFAAAAGGSDADDYENGWLLPFAAKYGHRFEAADFFLQYYEDRGANGEKTITACPNDDAHSDAGNSEDKGFFCVNASESSGGTFAAKCMHDSCAELDRLKMLDLACIEFELTEDDLKKFLLEVEDDDAEDIKDAKTELATYEDLHEYASQSKGTPDDLKKIVAWLKSVKPKDHDAIAEEALISRLVQKRLITKKTIVTELRKYRANREDWQEAEDDDENNAGDQKAYKKLMKEMNEKYAMVRIASNYMVATLDRPDADGGFPVLSVEGFKLETANSQVAVPVGNETKFMSAGEAWIKCPTRKEFKGGIVFDPDPKFNDKDSWNIWTGFETKPVAGECPMIIKHIRDVLCGGNDDHYNWLMTWLAHMVQMPHHKPGSAILVKGPKGVGKSAIFENLMSVIVGQRHFLKTADKDKIFGRFNGHLVNKLLVLMEEGSWVSNSKDSFDRDGKMKDFITSSQMSYEDKGRAVFNASNYSRLIILTNNEAVAKITADERRYFAIEVPLSKKLDTEYYDAFWAELRSVKAQRAFMHLLTTWEPPYNEGWNILFNPPQTAWLRDQQNHTATSQEEFFIELLEEGMVPEIEHLNLDEIILNEDEETRVRKTLLREYFCHRAFGNSTFGGKLQAFKNKTQQYLGLDMGSHVTWPRESHMGKNVEVVVIPPLTELRKRARASNLIH